MQKYRFVIVGGGTAGMIASTLIKTFWKDSVDVTVVYDHKSPGIGVGESLTPTIYDYLNYVKITREDMIKNVDATIKLGLKFKNWLNDDKYFYHGFIQHKVTKGYPSYDWESGYEISHNVYDQGMTYSKFYYEMNQIPLDNKFNQTLHIDAVLFGRYIEKKFKDQLNIVDGIVSSIVKDDKGITHLILSDNRQIEGDFFIDASGFQRVLFKHLDNKWIDKSDWLPIDACIPNPLPWQYKWTIPVYTTAEATDQGWILQVPLQSRWGTGYLYSTKFLDDDTAFTNFKNFLDKNYGENTLYNTSRILRFKSGYWEKQWVDNCLCLGLSSGFSEPLEATNIHHLVYQTWRFIGKFNFRIFNHDIKRYNKEMLDFYDDIYLYLRYCYTTNRTDSEFWKYMTYSTPEEIKDLEEKIHYDLLDSVSLDGIMFNWGNFTQVGYGLGKINRKNVKDYITNTGLAERSKNLALNLKIQKYKEFGNSVDHLQYIKKIKNE